MDGRRFADDQEPSWYGDRDYAEPSWRSSGADAVQPDDDYRPSRAERPRRAADPLTDPTGFSDHWRPRSSTDSGELPEQTRSSRHDYTGTRAAPEIDTPGAAALTGRGVEALPVVKPTPSEPTAPYATGDIPRFRTEAIDRSALRRPATPEPPPVEPSVDDAPVSGGAYPYAAPGGERVYSTRRPIIAVPIALVVILLEIPALRLLLDGATGGPAGAGRMITGLALALSLPLTGMGLYALLTAGRAADHRTWWRPPLAHLPIGLILLVAAAIAAR